MTASIKKALQMDLFAVWVSYLKSNRSCDWFYFGSAAATVFY